MCNLMSCDVFKKALPYREELEKLCQLRDNSVWKYVHTDRINELIKLLAGIESEICSRELSERKEYSTKKREFLSRMEESFEVKAVNAQPS